MRRWWRPHNLSWKRILGAAVSCGAVIAGLSLTSAGDFVEKQSAHRLDYLLRSAIRLDPPLAAGLKTFVFDDAAMSHLGAASPTLSQWATMIEALAARGPAAILIDKLFDVPAPPEEARAFVERLQRVKPPVAIAAFAVPRPLAGRAVLPASVASQQALTALAATTDPARAHYIYGAPASLQGGWRAFGHVSYLGDGLVQPALVFDAGAGVIPHLALLAGPPLGVVDGRLSSGGKVIPVDSAGRLHIDVIDPKAYPARTFGMKALLAKAARGESIDVVERGDTVLLLPAMYTGNGDWVKTPHGEAPGGYVVMSLVSSAIGGHWINPVDGGVVATGAGALAGGAAAALVSYGFFWIILVVVLLLAPLGGAAALGLIGVQLAWFFPLLAFEAAALAVYYQRARANEREAFRIGQELVMACAIQELFFPGGKLASSNDYGGVKVLGVTKPLSECSGDWWGCEVVRDQGVAIFICDAMGHGVSAALLMASAIAAVTAACRAPPGNGPAALLQSCNEVVHAITRGNACVSMMCIVADVQTRTLRIANAGQHKPLILSGSREVKSVRIAGNPLGVFAKERYSEVSVELAAGERLLAFSDGLVEARNLKGQQLGRWGLIDTLRMARTPATAALVDEVFAAWAAHLDGIAPDDDVTLAVIEFA